MTEREEMDFPLDEKKLIYNRGSYRKPMKPYHTGHKHTEESKKKLSVSGKKRTSFYDDLLAKKLGMTDKIDWTKLRHEKLRSSRIAGK